MKEKCIFKERVILKWRPKFAYAIGLLVSDGCLSKDGRHIILTSNDVEQLNTFNDCLGLSIKIGQKYSGTGNMSYYIQFSDVYFYRYLQDIGLMPAKSKILSEIKIPKEYFIDYLRGYFDGDGCSYSYFDPVYKNSYRFYISFASGSERYVIWLRSRIFEYMGIKGSIDKKIDNKRSVKVFEKGGCNSCRKDVLS